MKRPAPLGGWIRLAAACSLLAAAGCQPFIKEQAYPPPPPPVVAPPPPLARPTFYVNASRLNLRACPGMDCPKIYSLERNEEVEQVGESEEWSQVRLKRDGTIGWVATRFLSAVPVAAEKAPVPLPPPVPALPTPEAAKPAPPPPERPALPERPPLPEKPKPVRPAEPPAGKPAPKPAEAAEPQPARPPAEKPVPVPKPPEERPKPAPAPEPPAEQPKKIRIM